MELLWKTVAGCLMAVILTLALGKQSPEMTVLLSLAACVMTAAVALGMVEPVLEFLWSLQTLTNVDAELMELLLRLAGIGVVCQLTATICSDAGCAALGKSIQLLGSGAMLSQSLPLLRLFVRLVQDILGGI